MKRSICVELAAKRRHERPNAWRGFARSSALAFATVWALGTTSALAASFGAFSIVDIYDRSLNENPGDFFGMDPAAPSLPNVLFPGSTVYANGAVSTAITFGRSGGFGSSSADLAAGTLRAFSTSSSSVQTQTVNSSAGFSDTLTPLANGVLQFDLVINGTIASDTAYGGGWFAVDGQIVYGTGGEIDPCLTTLTSSCSFSFLVSVTAGVPVQFSAAIEAYALDGSTADLSNTATLRATGVPFTSDSGVFLTAVPEPGAMLLLGFAWAAGSAWRSRRKAARRVD